MTQRARFRDRFRRSNDTGGSTPAPTPTDCNCAPETDSTYGKELGFNPANSLGNPQGVGLSTDTAYTT